jgi:protein-tyrosine phosphatase
VLPTAVRRTFTLREFADLAGLAVRLGLDRRVPGPPAQRLAALVAAAPRLRAARGVGERDDIEDPYGRDAGTFARVLTEISDAVDAVAGAVRGADRPAAGVPPGRGDEYVEDEVG